MNEDEHLLVSCIFPIAISILIMFYCMIRLQLFEREHSPSAIVHHSRCRMIPVISSREAPVVTSSEDAPAQEKAWKQYIEKRQQIIQEYQRLFIILTFIVLPTASTAILRTFHCEELADGREYLIVDYNTNCEDEEYYSYITFCVIMCFIYPIGIPMLYFVLLYTNRDRINPRVGNTAIALRTRSQDKSLQAIDFLYMYYRPEHWWFEVVEAIRRVFMTGGLIFTPGNHRATVGFACACFSLVLYQDIAPFLTYSVNILGVSAQWLLIIVYFSGVLLLYNPILSTSTVLGICLFTGTITLLLLAGFMQWKLGSSLHQTELETLDYERRNTEMMGSIQEMRNDINSKQKDWEKASAFIVDDQQEGLEKSVLSDTAHIFSDFETSKKLSVNGVPISRITFRKPLYPCYVISLKNLRSLNRLCSHERALELGLLEILSPTSRRPSCELTFYCTPLCKSANLYTGILVLPC